MIRITLFRTLLLGVVGAWLGFAVGALTGVAIDVIASTGIYVAIVGHLMAIVGAVVALKRYAGVPHKPGASFDFAQDRLTMNESMDKFANLSYIFVGATDYCQRL